jgi:hypothetical protein
MDFAVLGPLRVADDEGPIDGRFRLAEATVLGERV